MNFRLRGEEDEVFTLLKHAGRVRLVIIMCLQQEWGKVVTGMQEPFQVLTDLLSACPGEKSSRTAPARSENPLSLVRDRNCV